jgi:hypothetical protein
MYQQFTSVFHNCNTISLPCDQQSSESERQIPSFMEWGICNVLPGKGYDTLQDVVMKLWLIGENRRHTTKKLLQCYFVNHESHIKLSSTECKAMQWEASNYLICSMTIEIMMHIRCAWSRTSSVQQAITHKFHYQLVAQCLCLLYSSTCCGNSFLPSSRSYKFDQHLQRIWQLVIEDWQTIFLLYYIVCVCVCVCSLPVCYDKLPFTLYTLIKLVASWRWPVLVGALYKKYKHFPTSW